MNSPSIQHRREELEARIEDLISLLDVIDGDPDIEENGDEHDAGMPWNWAPSSTSSCGTVLEDDEDGGDTEPNGDEIDTNHSEDGPV